MGAFSFNGLASNYSLRHFNSTDPYSMLLYTFVLFLLKTGPPIKKPFLTDIQRKSKENMTHLNQQNSFAVQNSKSDNE